MANVHMNFEEDDGFMIETPKRYRSSSASLESITGILEKGIAQLESRMSTCTSIYNLATQTNNARDAENQKTQENIDKQLKSISERMIALEARSTLLVQNARSNVKKEIEGLGVIKSAEEMIQLFSDSANEEIDNLEKAISEQQKKTERSVQRIKREIEEYSNQEPEEYDLTQISAKVREARQSQQELVKMIKAIRQEEAQ